MHCNQPPTMHCNQPTSNRTGQSAYHPLRTTISLSPTVQYNQPVTHRAMQSACHPPRTTISLPPTVQYNQNITHRAVQLAYHPLCSTISLPPIVQYNQPITHCAVQSAYHPPCSAISLSPVNMPDPIRIRSRLTGKHWPDAGQMILAHWLASGPDPFGHNLTQSARTRSDLGWFCTIYYPRRLWKNRTESESGKLVASRLCIARNRDR